MWLKEKETLLNSSTNHSSHSLEGLDFKIKECVCNINSTRSSLLDHSLPSKSFLLCRGSASQGVCFTGGTSKASALLKRIQELNRKLDKAFDARQAFSPLERSQIYDLSSTFWTQGPALNSANVNCSAVDAYCAWQSHIQEQMLLKTDLRIHYSHAKQDTAILTQFQEREVRTLPRKLVEEKLSMYAKRMELIRQFFQSQNHSFYLV